MYRKKHYPRDPYWTTARFDSISKTGETVRKGDRIFYYPNSKTVYVGQAAEKAAADFYSGRFDESVYNGGTL